MLLSSSGSSIPIIFLPGITATLADTAFIDIAISSARLTTREDFVPIDGCNSKSDTTGPGLMLTISPVTLYFNSISMSSDAFCSSSSGLILLL